ncbi:MAG: FkbM family methyltransferase [Cyclobacteriaceae bacterium]|nr:FkbM family methyltransferase [Cyclobacteriaceae bacterium]
MMKRRLLFIRGLFIKFFLSVKTFVGIRSTVFKLKSGEFLKIRNMDKLGLTLINGESFEDEAREFIMNNVKEGMVVLDIGANIGYYTIKISSIVGATGKVLAFEPNPAMIEELRDNTELNKVNNVKIFPVALSDKRGELPFCLPQKGNEAHGSLKQNRTFKSVETINVPAITLDELLEKENINKVDFIKIDVEGGEYEVLRGASKLLSSKHKPVIIFESVEYLIKPFGHKVFDVLKLVADNGYEIEAIDFGGNWVAKPI